MQKKCITYGDFLESEAELRRLKKTESILSGDAETQPEGRVNNEELLQIQEQDAFHGRKSKVLTEFQEVQKANKAHHLILVFERI